MKTRFHPGKRSAENFTVPADTIRLASFADGPAITRLIEYSRLAGSASAGDRAEARALLEADRAGFERAVRDGACYVAESEGEIIGVCAWGWDADLAERGRAPRASVRALAIHPAYRRLTLSRLLLILCESAALRRGADSIDAFARQFDRWVYLACGFQPIGPYDAWCPNGVIAPGLLVRKWLCDGRAFSHEHDLRTYPRRRPALATTHN
jgi:GNAT superfamily N-acetyltransferase